MRGDRLKMEAGAAGPVAQGRPVEPDALPGVDVRLPIERQMVTEFGDDDLGDHGFRRRAAGHDVLGRNLATFSRNSLLTPAFTSARITVGRGRPIEHVRHLASRLQFSAIGPGFV
jgi:hypothetical protein